MQPFKGSKVQTRLPRVAKHCGQGFKVTFLPLGFIITNLKIGGVLAIMWQTSIFYKDFGSLMSSLSLTLRRDTVFHNELRISFKHHF